MMCTMETKVMKAKKSDGSGDHYRGISTTSNRQSSYRPTVEAMLHSDVAVVRLCVFGGRFDNRLTESAWNGPAAQCGISCASSGWTGLSS